MKRLFLIALAAVVLFLVGRMVVRALADDETKIRWIVEEMRDGYNDGGVGDVVGPLHLEWRHRGSGVDRDLVRGGLVREFFQERDPKTKQLTRRVDVDLDALEIEVTGDEATLGMEAAFSRWRGEQWAEVWRARIEGDLVRVDGRWRLLRSRHEDLAGSVRAR